MSGGGGVNNYDYAVEWDQGTSTWVTIPSSGDVYYSSGTVSEASVAYETQQTIDINYGTGAPTTFAIRIHNVSRSVDSGTLTVNLPDTTDELTASDVDTPVPVVGSPTAAHIHDLTASDTDTPAPLVDDHPVTVDLPSDFRFDTDAVSGGVVFDRATRPEHHATASDVDTPAPVTGSPTLAEAGGDNLTADDVDTPAPVVGSPSIGQIHALAANDVDTPAPVVGSPEIGQEHGLAADDTDTPAPVTGLPTATHIHDLIATGLATGPPVVGAPIYQAVLEATDTDTPAPVTGEPVLARIPNLTADDTDTPAPVTGAPVLAEAGSDDLTADDVDTPAPLVGSPDLGQVHGLAANDTDLPAPTTGTPTLPAWLEGGGLSTPAPVTGSPALGQEHGLAADDVDTPAPLVGGPALGQEHGLIANDVDTPAPVTGAPVLAEGSHSLSADDTDTPAPVTGSPVLARIPNLTANDTDTPAPVTGAPDIGQEHALTADDCVTPAPLTGTPVAAEGVHNLDADGISTPAPLTGGPDIGQVHICSAIGVAIPAPVVGSPTIGQIHALAGNDTTAGAPVTGTPTAAIAAFLGGDVSAGFVPSSYMFEPNEFRFDTTVVTGGHVFDRGIEKALIYTFNGQVVASFTPASTMSGDATYSGDVTFTLTPASSMGTADLLGSTTATFTPAAVFGEAELVGDISISFTPQARFVRPNDFRFDDVHVPGGVAFDLGVEVLGPPDIIPQLEFRVWPEASYNFGYYLEPTFVLNIWPEATFNQPSARFQGGVTLSLTPSANYYLFPVLDGEVYFNPVPGSSMDYSPVGVGYVETVFTPNATFGYTWRLDGDATFTLGVDGKMGGRLDGDITATFTPNSTLQAGPIYWDGQCYVTFQPRSRMFADVVLYDEFIQLDPVKKWNTNKNVGSPCHYPQASFEGDVHRIWLSVTGDELDDTNGIAVHMNYVDGDTNVGDLPIYSATQKLPWTLLYDGMEVESDSLLYRTLRDKLMGGALSLVCGGWEYAPNDSHARPIKIDGPVTVRVKATGY